jgi:hypothetical protein
MMAGKRRMKENPGTCNQQRQADAVRPEDLQKMLDMIETGTQQRQHAA